jgi:hypothetical protein
MVNCWNKLNEAPKWKIGYAAYMEALKNGTAMTDVEDDAPGQNALPSRQSGKKSTKVLKVMLAESQDTMAKQDEKKRLEKDATTCIYINLTKEAIEVKRLDAGVKCRAEDTRIMLADLRNMDGDQRSWFEKKRAKIRQRDA